MCTDTHASAPGNFAVPLSDTACFAVLDALEVRASLPTDCDPAGFVEEGLIVAIDGGWQLTAKGRLTLANLRSVQRHQLTDLRSPRS
jgi:hypothetical protein